MSWIEKVTQDMIIRTPDGKEYRPWWFSATNAQAYNTSNFDFTGYAGTLVIRGYRKGKVFEVDFVFQGDDCLDVADAFDKSVASSTAPISFYHPMHGLFSVQPSELRFDKTVLNNVKVTGVFTETLAKAPKTVTLDPPAKIAADAAVVVDTAAESYAEEVPVMQVTDLERLQARIDAVYETILAKIANVQENRDAYTAAYNDANAALNIAIYQTTDIIGAASNLISTPYMFANTVAQRVDMFKDQLDLFKADIAGLLAMSESVGQASLKRLYEVNAAAALTGMLRATVTNVANDYNYRPNVLRVIADVIRYYNDFVNNLCTLQTPNRGYKGAYLANADTIVPLAALLYYTVGVLHQYAEDAKQQRTYFVQYDTNIINIAEEVYGLLPDDSTIHSLIEANNIAINEHLIIRKGRELVYYL